MDATLKGLDEHWVNLIEGDAAIARAAGYKTATYFINTEYVYKNGQLVEKAPRIFECHNGIAHAWLVDGKLRTHPGSAEWVGQQKRDKGKAAQIANLVGCYAFTAIDEPDPEAVEGKILSKCELQPSKASRRSSK